MEITPETLKKGRANLLRALARHETGVAQRTVPIPRRQPQTAPLSYSQARLWFLDQIEPDNPAYNIPATLRLAGRLDENALRAALTEIVRRHEILRTSISVADGEPIQRVHDEVPAVLPLVDLEAMAPEEREREARLRIQAEYRQPFDLARGPLFRFTLLRLEPEEHILLLTLHHIVSDAWSSRVLNRELFTLYNAYLAGKPSPLPELAIQYADYAAWQREWLQGERLESLLTYWKQKLSGAPALLELPADRPRPPIQSFRGAFKQMELPVEVAEELAALSRREGVTLFMTLLAAFQTLLFRYSGQEDIVVGTPIANRTRPEVEGLIGFFINTLAMRGDLSGDPSFRDMLARVRETALGAYAHQELPFERLVEELHPDRSLSHAPVFQVVFDFQTASGSASELDGLRIRSVGGEWVTAKFDLLLTAQERKGRLWLGLEHNTDLFNGERIERLLGYFRTLLEGIVRDPDQRISRLPLLPEEERRQLQVEWNDTAAEYPRERCLHELFEEQAQRTPEAVAVVCGDQKVTYNELDRQANQLAQTLLEFKIGPEACVGVCLERSPALIVAVLGILKAGAVYVPLDPSFPPARLRLLLSDTGAVALVTQSAMDAQRIPFSGSVLSMEGDQVRSAPETAPEVLVDAEQLAYVMYTSGSTGQPKGIGIPHRAVTRLVCETDYVTMGADRTMAQLANVAFDASTWEIWGALIHGAKLVIIERDAALVPEELARRLQAGGVRELFLTTALFNQVVENAPEAFDGLEDLLFGGERVDVAHVRAVVERRSARGCGPYRLLHVYGPTESTTYASWYAVEDVDSSAATIPIGRPIANTQMYVLDAQMGLAPTGVFGELYVGGEGLARGYLNRADLTAEKFVPDPFSGEAGARLYRTGDLCRYLWDGNLEFVGRVDHQVKVRGFRIELGEIESVLGSHPQVREAVVLAREDAPGDRRLAAYVVGSAEPPTATELREHLRQTLPEYMVPSAFVFLEALPLTPNGKVDRKALPEPKGREWQQAYVAPRTPIEEGLAEIFAELLSVESVGIADNFFELGGHSLLATQVISRLRSTFQVELPLRALFEAPTVAGLAVRVEQVSGQLLEAPPLSRVSREKPVPLSFSQQRLWFLDQLEPESPFYNISNAFRLSGLLNVAALEQSLQQIVRRHEALRTTFALVDAEPVQVIGECGAALESVDLSRLPDTAREREALRLTQEEAQRPFDLEQGPLFRSLLLRLGDQEHILVLTMHHIVSDGWSHAILLREIQALYAAYSQGKPDPLPPLAIQYGDYACWQRQWLQGEVLERQLGYWKGQLSGAPALLELPADRPRPQVQSYRGHTISARYSSELLEGLRSVCRREGSTLFMTLMAAFQTLLMRYSGQEDVVVGTAIANRTSAETECLIGCFFNSLALRSDLSGDPSFRELLGRVRETALVAYAHQHLPFEKLVEELAPERSLSHSPIFQIMFLFQNTPRRAPEVEGVRIERVRHEGTTATYDIIVSMSESKDGLGIAISYNTDLFDRERIERLLVHFQTLLEGIVVNPERRLSRLPLLTQAEQQQIAAWNGPVIKEMAQRCIHEVFEKQVERAPDAIAVVVGDQQLTYRELNARANRLAHYLLRRGVSPETLVGLCVERSVEMLVGLLGILKAGGAYLPLDPAYPLDRLAFMIADAQAPLLLTQEHLRDRLAGYGAAVVCLDAADAFAAESMQDPPSHATPGNLAYVIFTSGSTGRPKAVQISHWQVPQLVEQLHPLVGASSQDCWSVFHSVAFDFSVWELWSPLLSGGRLVLVPTEATQSPEQLSALLARERVSILNLTPSVLGALLLYWRESRKAGPGPMLHSLHCGGEALPREMAREALALGLPMWNFYGPTESTVWASLNQVGSADLVTPQVCLGSPFAGRRLYVLDRHLLAVPTGVTGELCIGGEGLARGYLHNPELTAEKFVPDPFSSEAGARMYRTGDLARYLPNGNIEFLGRVDHQVKVRGFRIELGEIESVLASHPQVREAVVLAREDKTGEKRLVAYVVGEEQSAGAMREHLRGVLPEYMVPSLFVFLEALPLSPNGKIDRKALPSPDDAQVSLKREYEAPQTTMELEIARIWGAVLRQDRIGIHDSFFELGGHSLLATQVMARVRAIFGVELPLRALFETPTVAALSRSVEELKRRGEVLTCPPLIARPHAGSASLSFAQQRLWFLDQLDPGNSVYNIPIRLRLSGPLNQNALARTLTEIVRRHEALRTTVTTADGEPVQVIHSPQDVPLPLTDLSHGSEQEQRRRRRETEKAEAQASFDLEQGPLFRAGLLRLGDQDHLLLLTLHHIVSDGWSLGVLMRELGTLYPAFCDDRPSPLPELALQYADYAVWQRAWLQGEALERQLGYWKAQLGGAPALLELPTDRPRPAMQSFRGASQGLELSAELTQGLQALSQQAGTTLFMTLLAGFMTLLGRYSGQDDIVVGTPIANRQQTELEGLIGYFANTLALRGNLSGDPSFRELLARVKEVALGAYAHQDLPFEKLVEELQPERSLSHSPVFQVMLMLQNAPRTSLELEELRVQALGGERVTSPFDLSLSLSESGGKLRGALEYNTDLFDAERMERLLSHFRTLLEGIVADPEQRLSRLPLLTPSERHQVLEEWNATAVAYPRERCIHELFEEQVARTPEAVAVVFENQRLTYRELNARANQLARSLVAEGVGPETLVGVCLERSLEMLIGLLGILKAGGAYVPLDPTYPAERLTFMLQDCQAPIVIARGAARANLREYGGRLLQTDLEATAIDRMSAANLGRRGAPATAAYVIYTSGSTSRPKGVVVTQGNLVHSTLARRRLYAHPPKKFLLLSSFAFDSSVAGIFWTLCEGGCLVLPHRPIQEDLPGIRDQIVAQEITHYLCIPSLHQILVDAFGTCSPDALQTVIVAGESCTARVVRAHQDQLPWVSLYNEYGPTETTVWATACEVGPREAGEVVPIGRAIANARTYLLDPTGQPVPVGVSGELYIGGAGLGRGYLNRADLTAEKFVPDPFSGEAGARLYRTGDLCRYLWDGNLEFVGRVDHQVKVRGFRIELGEIESVLGSHPQVREAVVLAREDAPGDRRLAAYVVGSAEPPTATELREHLRQTLPEYMVPSAFVFLEALPLTPNGKLDRNALPAPDAARPALDAAFQAPTTPAETILAGIWTQVLRLEQVGIHDNFFELGGDSILSIQIIARANQAGLRLTPRQVFQHQTIASLAAVGGTGVVVHAQQGVVAGPVALTPIQHWYFERHLADPHHYNQVRLLQLRPEVRPETLARLVAVLVDHHDALRMRFVGTPTGWQQTNAAAQEDSVFSCIDLSALPEPEQASALTAACTQLQASLNLGSGPLLRVGYFDLGADQPARLLLAIHHLVVDVVSWQVLLSDLRTLLEQIGGGQALTLPPKTTSFQSWSGRLEEYAQSPTLRRERDYWLSVVGGAVGGLPLDQASGSNPACDARQVRVSLSEVETRALLHEVPSAYHTQINDVLLCALEQALTAWAGGQALLVDVEGHGREALFEEVDLSRTVGWFTSLFPVRLEGGSVWDPGERLKSMKERLRQIPHHGLGYGLLRYLCQDAPLRAELAAAPRAQVSFNYLGQFDGVVADEAAFRMAGESSGRALGLQAELSHPLSVLSQVSGSRLHLTFTYGTQLHRSSTIEGVAHACLDALRALIAHCGSVGVGGFTPSDFPEAHISQKALDRFLASMRKQ